MADRCGLYGFRFGGFVGRSVTKVAVVVGVVVFVGSCSGDGGPFADPAVTTALVGNPQVIVAPEPEILSLAHLDVNGDGEVQIGVALTSHGCCDELTQRIEALAEGHGFDGVIVDESGDLDALAGQSVDLVIVVNFGAGVVAETAAKYPDIYWWCSCGGEVTQAESFALTQFDHAGINYKAGVAFGLLLQQSGGDNVAMMGCCEFSFQTEVFLAFQLGLQSVDPDFTVTFWPTNDFGFPIDHIARATEVFNAAVADGADAVYPYVNRPIETIATLAGDAGLIVAHPGSSVACNSDVSFDIAVRFDSGDYIEIVLSDIVDGKFPEGSVRVFGAGTDPDIAGAEICGTDRPTGLQAAYDLLAAGELDDDFATIKAAATAD